MPVSNTLGRALAASLLLHALLLAGTSRLLPRPEAGDVLKAVLSVSLREEQPRLILEPAPRHAIAEPPRPTPRAKPEAKVPAKMPDVPASEVRLSGAAARAANEQMARGLLYPLEAIERGLEGEAVVRLFLDSSGNVITSRLEQSSGHALLDDAAVRAARTLRSLPDNAPREAVLPVRFRLR
jgi:protein TonB